MARKRRIKGTARAEPHTPETRAAEDEASEATPPLEEAGTYEYQTDEISEDITDVAGDDEDDAPSPELESIEEEEPEEEPAETKKSRTKRDELYDDIERRREEREAKQREQLAAVEDEDDDAPAPADTPAEPAEDDDPDVTMKVDRQNITKKRSEWDDDARRSHAEGNRLEELNRLLPEVRALLSAPTTATPEPAPEEPAAPSSADEGSEPTPPMTRDTARGIVDRIQTGDLDEGADALLEAIDSVAKPSVDANAISQLIDQNQRKFDVERSIQQEMARFSETFPNVAEDPVLIGATFNQMHVEQLSDIEKMVFPDGSVLKETDMSRLREEPRLIPDWHRQYRDHGFDVRPISEVVDSAGKFVQEKYILPKPAQEQRGSTQLEQRREAKRTNLQRQPRRATATPSQTVPQSQSTSSVIGEMRARRVGRHR